MWGFVGWFHIKSTFILPDKILKLCDKSRITGSGALQNLDTKWNHRFILLYASATRIDVKIYSSRLVIAVFGMLKYIVPAFPFFRIQLSNCFEMCTQPAVSRRVQGKVGRLVGVQTDRILSDRIRLRIRKLDTDIRYPNIRADTDTDMDMIFNFNYSYPNSRYIICSLIFIIEKFMLFTIIKSGYPYPYPSNIWSVSVFV